MGFNIASHTLNHAFLSEILPEQALHEMMGSKIILQQITGHEIDWLVLPRGRGNEEVYREAFKLGYKYIRTTKLYDESEKIRGGCHLSYPRKEYNGTDPFVWAKKSNLKHYWLHMFELIKFNKMKEFEDFLIWYKETNA